VATTTTVVAVRIVRAFLISFPLSCALKTDDYVGLSRASSITISPMD
jgi:hypothetical protein